MSIDAGHATAEIPTRLTAQALLESTLDEMSAKEDRVQFSLDPEAAKCLVDLPLQSVSQALRSVLQNALDASSNQPVAVEVTRNGDSLRIVIRDEGAGMTAEVLERADEPFFTTKETGKGMGLGRFLARTVFDRVGGTFETESCVGVGTTVTVQIPTWLNQEVDRA